MSSDPGPRVRIPRVLGQIVGNLPGPTVIVCGALHGNESAGVHAARNVQKSLSQSALPLRGEWLAIIGNLAAFTSGCRYQDQDLNRCWTHEQVDALRASDPANDRTEQLEQRAILDVLDQATRDARGPIVLIDLHTTSSKSPPFLVFSDSLANRAIAARLPGTMLLGIEEMVDGTLLDYVSEIGHRAVVIESGQHQDPAAISLHESYLWLALEAAGSLTEDEIPDFAEHRRTLQRASRGSPRCVDIQYRHAIVPEDNFRMDPGHQTLSRVQKDQSLAQDKNGDVRAPCSGLMLMPLYQAQGSDGFFIAGVVHPIWLALSRLLRTLKLHGLLVLLPGVRRAPDQPKTLWANPRIARWLTIEVFHLFGYRNRGSEAGLLQFVRRDEH